MLPVQLNAELVYRAEVAELADARGSGPRTRKGVGVRVPSSAPKSLQNYETQSKSFARFGGLRLRAENARKYRSWSQIHQGRRRPFSRKEAMNEKKYPLVTNHRDPRYLTLR